MLVLDSLLILFFIPFFFFLKKNIHRIEKMYPNGLLKDAINNRSILSPAIRFSHDRSSNGANGDGKTINSDNSSASTTKTTDNHSEQVRHIFNETRLHALNKKHCAQNSWIFQFQFESYRFRHRRTIAVCPVAQIVFGFNMLRN